MPAPEGSRTDPESRPVGAGADVSVAVTISLALDDVGRNDSAQSRLDPEPRHVRLDFVVLPRRWCAFLLAVGVWSWIIWPTFLRNIWKDDRSFDHGPTGFLLVHVALTAVSLVIGTVVGVLGWRGWRASSRGAAATEARKQPAASPAPIP